MELKLSGVMFGDGKTQEFVGPHRTVAEFTVLENMLVMLDTDDLGNLLRYRNLIERLKHRKLT